MVFVKQVTKISKIPGPEKGSDPNNNNVVVKDLASPSTKPICWNQRRAVVVYSDVFRGQCDTTERPASVRVPLRLSSESIAADL